MTSSLPKPALLAIAALLLPSCTVGPNYERPLTPEPGAWHTPLDAHFSGAPVERAELASWWQTLGDEQLTGLVGRAIAGNLDLWEARERIREADAHRESAVAALYPTVRGRVTVSPVKPSRSSNQQATGLELFWNLDTFGGLHRAVEASLADLGASQEGLRQGLVDVAANVAQSYVDVRSFQARFAIAQENLEAQSQTLAIATWRAQAGLVTALDVEQARSDVEQTRAAIPTLRSGFEEASNRLAVLLGQTPGALAEELAVARPIPEPPAQIAVGIPADALEGRPDVRRAEREVAAETARVGQAKAAEYPTISFTGALGTEAISLAGQSAGFSIGAAAAASALQTIFDHGAIRARLRAQKAVREESLAHFQSTVLNALEDVESAIATYREELERRDGLARAAASAQRAADMLREQYASGLVDFLAVLDANRSLFSLQDQLAVSQSRVVSDLIHVYRSLGGGWREA
jgi:NodT family efflux transporter outer membrane factor (OMF) lipoprotein